MIKIDSLVKRYGEKVAIDDLSLHVKKGTIFGLLGVNGAGKTTLVSILNGLSGYDSGRVEVAGLDLRENIEQIRSKSAFIPQSLAFYEQLSVLENLNFFAGIQNIQSSKIEDQINRAVETSSLESLLYQSAKTLSGGQKRRLNIAIGLLNDPEILYFDEPTVGIDPASRNEILETILSFKKSNKTVVYTTHYMPEIEKICDEVAIIDRGRVVSQGSLEQMLECKDKETVFDLFDTPLQLLHGMPLVSVIDHKTLKLNTQDTDQIESTLRELHMRGVRIKQIRLDSSTLEKVFIDLTSKEAH